MLQRFIGNQPNSHRWHWTLASLSSQFSSVQYCLTILESPVRLIYSEFKKHEKRLGSSSKLEKHQREAKSLREQNKLEGPLPRICGQPKLYAIPAGRASFWAWHRKCSQRRLAAPRPRSAGVTFGGCWGESWPWHLRSCWSWSMHRFHGRSTSAKAFNGLISHLTAF